MHEWTAYAKLRLWAHCGTECAAKQNRALRARFPDLHEAFALAQRGDGSAFPFLPPRTAERLVAAAQDGWMERFVEMLIKKRIDFVLDDEREYPALLKEIHDAPDLLFVCGSLPAEPALALSVIGTRAPSDYGRDVARLFAHTFAEAGAVVVSGMASGVDACAARGALDCAKAACPTVAVLGTGVDVVYPAENRRLYAEIIARGAVVSEFLPGTGPQPHQFPIRNRIMSGMSHGVVIVEAGERSGTSITAGFALEEGREVFAVPGRITDAKSLGPNRMIRCGEAKPVFSAADVLVEFPGFAGGAPEGEVEHVALSDLTDAQQRVVKQLREGEYSIDALCENLALPIGELNSILTELHFSGIIKQLPGRVYTLDTMHCIVQ